jgi:bifunctional non-homologous end joining protein LigD
LGCERDQKGTIKNAMPIASKKPQRSGPKTRAGFVEPMKATLVANLPKGEEWIYEVKFDGVRALAIKRGNELELLSRANKDLSYKFGEVLKPLAKLVAKDFVLDGEVVAMDPAGRSSFQLLQNYQSTGEPKTPLLYYVFDLIHLDGKDLTAIPLTERKALAESLVRSLGPVIRFSQSIKADSQKLMSAMQAQGLEGLIAKRRDSKYEAGRRSGNWVKFKWTNEQEFVIGGFSEPKGSRNYFGSLLVGYYDGKIFKFAAKVGTGFDEKSLAALHAKFHKLRQPNCPFANLPEKPPGLTASQLRRCTWIRPTLVAQVRFAEWTRDGHLRQPAFLGLREDKKPSEVVREKPG